ncbi:MAG: DUF3794 domain-containing protein, partial [Clostridia bacterium]|nr:DUF3794 domain-containing protein [Clostridia bacterium]
KIDIHGAIGVYVAATRRKTKDILSDTENGDIELLHSVIPATLPVANAEKYLIIEEDIEVGNANPDARWLIRYDAEVSTDECKLLAGKAMVKGEIAVNLLYRAQEGEPQQLNTVIPFSQLIEVEGADENCTAQTYAEIAYLEIKPKFNTSGLSRSFSLDGKLLLGVNVQCGGDIEVVTDAYSRAYQSRTASEEITLISAVCEVNDTFNCRRETELPEAVSRICDIWCEVRESTAEFEGDCLIAKGNATANIIAFDDSGAPVFYEKGIDFEYRFKLPRESANFKGEPQVSVLSVSYTIQSENRMEIRAEMAIHAVVFESKTLSVINDIQVDTGAAAGERAAMTVYFAEAGESVWDISRKYLASVDEVKRINGIESDKLSERRTVLVPAN